MRCWCDPGVVSDRRLARQHAALAAGPWRCRPRRAFLAIWVHGSSRTAPRSGACSRGSRRPPPTRRCSAPAGTRRCRTTTRTTSAIAGSRSGTSRGVPARELAERAGHSRPSMSLDVYSHVMPTDELRRVGSKADQLTPAWREGGAHDEPSSEAGASPLVDIGFARQPPSGGAFAYWCTL